jgi:hypothetical protein
VEKLRDILARLDAAQSASDMDVPGFRLHRLKGGLKDFYAVTVRAIGALSFVSPTVTRLMWITWTITEEHELCL